MKNTDWNKLKLHSSRHYKFCVPERTGLRCFMLLCLKYNAVRNNPIYLLILILPYSAFCITITSFSSQLGVKYSDWQSPLPVG